MGMLWGLGNTRTFDQNIKAIGAAIHYIDGLVTIAMKNNLALTLANPALGRLDNAMRYLDAQANAVGLAGPSVDNAELVAAALAEFVKVWVFPTAEETVNDVESHVNPGNNRSYSVILNVDDNTLAKGPTPFADNIVALWQAAFSNLWASPMLAGAMLGPITWEESGPPNPGYTSPTPPTTPTTPKKTTSTDPIDNTTNAKSKINPKINVPAMPGLRVGPPTAGTGGPPGGAGSVPDPGQSTSQHGEGGGENPPGGGDGSGEGGSGLGPPEPTNTGTPQPDTGGGGNTGPAPAGGDAPGASAGGGPQASGTDSGGGTDSLEVYNDQGQVDYVYVVPAGSPYGDTGKNMPDPGGDSGGDEGRPTLPYGPHHSQATQTKDCERL